MQKSCSNCSLPAQFSFNAVISSVGVSKRAQKTSRAVLFCSLCLHEFADRLCSDTLSKSVNDVLTGLHECLRERLTAKTSISD
jgi:hypothetical protein